MIALDLLSVQMNDAGSYECLVKPYDGAAVAAIVNFTVYGKRLVLLAIDYSFIHLFICSET